MRKSPIVNRTFSPQDRLKKDNGFLSFHGIKAVAVEGFNLDMLDRMEKQYKEGKK